MYGLMAQVYDRLMADVDYDGWLSFTEQAFVNVQAQPKTVLDLACGTGAVTSRLLQRGYQVIGVDISPEMLAVCADRNMPYLESSQLLLLAQDMRKLGMPRSVDAVVCFLDSLNYLDSLTELQRVFKRISGVLAPGGVLVADLHTEYKLAALVGNETFTEVQEDMAYIWSNNYHPDTRSVEMELTFFVSSDEGLYQRFEEFHRQMWFSLDEIRAAVSGAGFELQGIYADLTWQPPVEESERYFLVARLPK